MNTPTLRRPLLEVFTAVLPLGADSKKKDDALAVTQVLKHLRPEMAELVLFEAHQHFHRKHYRTARELLLDADARLPANVLIKAMLAVTQFSMDDPSWEASAAEARELPPHPTADDFLHAIDVALGKAQAAPKDDDIATPPMPLEAPMAYFGFRC